MTSLLNDPLLIAAAVGVLAMLFWPQVAPLLAKLQKPQPAPSDDLQPVVIPDEPDDVAPLEVTTDDEARAVAWLLAERGRWHAAGREDVCRALTAAAKVVVGGAK